MIENFIERFFRKAWKDNLQILHAGNGKNHFISI